jgi:hypothetical protein
MEHGSMRRVAEAHHSRRISDSGFEISSLHSLALDFLVTLWAVERPK